MFQLPGAVHNVLTINILLLLLSVLVLWGARERGEL